MVHFASEPYLIGKHEWQIVVIPNPHYACSVALGVASNRYCTDFYWRRVGQVTWSNKDEWPTYNDHDGVYAGCPRSLIKLKEREEPSLAEFFPSIRVRYEASDDARQMALL